MTLKKRSLDELIHAKGGFGRIRDDYMFLCRKLKLKRPVQASAILDNYVRFSQSRENPVALKFSEAELEKLVRCKTRPIREARRELIQIGLLEQCGADSKGVLICKANLDKIDEETADWTPDWEDDPAYAPVKAKPRGRSAVVFIDRSKTGPAMAGLPDGDQDKSAVVPDPNNAWEQVKGRLAETLPQGAMQNWIAGTSLASLEDGALTVEVPNPTTAAWIEQEYSSQIHAAVTDLSLGVASVQYRVRSAVVEAGQISLGAEAEQTQFQASFAEPPIREETTEEQLASQLSKLTQRQNPDTQTMRNLNRVFAQLAPSLRGSALEYFEQRKIQGYGKRTIGGGILVNDAKEAVREFLPYYYFQAATLEQALAQMADDDRVNLSDRQKRAEIPQPISFPYGSPQFKAEFARLYHEIPRKPMGREGSHDLAMRASV
jgi:DnaA-like protein